MPKLSIKKNTDPYINNVCLFLPFNSNFNDNSSNNFSVTAYGNAQISSTQSKFGGSSAYFDGDGDYLYISSASQFGFGTGDFTIEAWVYPTSLQSEIVSVVDLRSGGGSNGVGLFIGASYVPNKIFFYNGSNNTAVTTDTEIVLNTWTHIVGQRSNGEWSVYINGVKDAQTINSFGDLTSSRPCFIGTACDGPGYFRNFAGYIDDVRITKGIARYTSNFIPRSILPNNDKLKLINSIPFIRDSTYIRNTALPILRSSITNFYNYSYDGGSSYIDDGGSDMYDSGNRVYLNGVLQTYNTESADTFCYTSYPFI